MFLWNGSKGADKKKTQKNRATSAFSTTLFNYTTNLVHSYTVEIAPTLSLSLYLSLTLSLCLSSTNWHNALIIK